MSIYPAFDNPDSNIFNPSNFDNTSDDTHDHDDHDHDDLVDETDLQHLNITNITFSGDNSIQTTAFTTSDKNKISNNETNINVNNQKLSNITYDSNTDLTIIPKIQTNQIVIQGQTQDIAYTTQHLLDLMQTQNRSLTNQSNISSNNNLIVTNQTAINNNSADILQIEDDISVIAGDVLTNQTNITNNTALINSNSNQINSNTSKLEPFTTSADRVTLSKRLWFDDVGYISTYGGVLRIDSNQSTPIALDPGANQWLSLYANTVNIGRDDFGKIYMNGEEQNHCYTDIDHDNVNSIPSLTTQVDNNSTQININTTELANINANINANANPVGTILTTAQPSTIPAPQGYLFCDGALVSISTYQNLYNLIGNTYQHDKPSYANFFYIPDLRQMFIKGSGLNQTYPIVAVPKGVGDFQSQSVMNHSHNYISANTSETANPTSSGSKTVGSNNYTNNLTSNVYDSNYIDITNSGETRPFCMNMNYLIKY